MITYEDFRDKRREYAFTKSVSDDPSDQDTARKIRTQMDYDDLKKQIGSKKKPAKAAVAESNGEKVDGKFMSYATMKAKGIKPKKSALDTVKDKVGRQNIYDPKRDKPTEAQKKSYAAHKAKIAKQDTRDATEKASDGRYSDRHSNRGSD